MFRLKKGSQLVEFRQIFAMNHRGHRYPKVGFVQMVNGRHRSSKGAFPPK
jgi:hypothetical protein